MSCNSLPTHSQLLGSLDTNDVPLTNASIQSNMYYSQTNDDSSEIVENPVCNDPIFEFPFSYPQEYPSQSSNATSEPPSAEGDFDKDFQLSTSKQLCGQPVCLLELLSAIASHSTYNLRDSALDTFLQFFNPDGFSLYFKRFKNKGMTIDIFLDDRRILAS